MLFWSACNQILKKFFEKYLSNWKSFSKDRRKHFFPLLLKKYPEYLRKYLHRLSNDQESQSHQERFQYY